jgi:hypothetical protein
MSRPVETVAGPGCAVVGYWLCRSERDQLAIQPAPRSDPRRRPTSIAPACVGYRTLVRLRARTCFLGGPRSALIGWTSCCSAGLASCWPPAVSWQSWKDGVAGLTIENQKAFEQLVTGPLETGCESADIGRARIMFECAICVAVAMLVVAGLVGVLAALAPSRLF